MNNQHWFIRNSVRSVMAALLLAAASGCGSSSDGENDENPGSPPAVVPAVPQTPQTNSLGETLCSKQGLGVDEDGRGFVEREIYNFDKINEEIARYPELAEATGFSEVTDCESARAYGEKYAAFNRAHPNFRGDPSKEAILDDFLSEPDAVGAPDPDGREVEKVFGGALGNRPAVVKIAIKAGLDDQDEYMICSAVRIAGTMFLTAAHCLPNPTSPDYQSFQVNIKRKRGSTEAWVGGGLGKPLNAYGKSYPGYMGLPNADFDFGIFWVIKQHHTLLSSEFDASATTLLAPRTPAVNDGQLVYGWGPQNNTEEAPATRLRTPSPEPTYRGIDVVGSHAWAIHDTGSAFRMCVGDSGGGALRDGMLDGITATIRPSPLQKCSETGLDMYWSRVDTKVQFVRQEMATLQQGSIKTPFKCRFHSGNPSDNTDWDHIISYIDCNEK